MVRQAGILGEHRAVQVGSDAGADNLTLKSGLGGELVADAVDDGTQRPRTGGGAVLPGVVLESDEAPEVAVDDEIIADPRPSHGMP